jgi:hypothetical protein
MTKIQGHVFAMQSISPLPESLFEFNGARETYLILQNNPLGTYGTAKVLRWDGPPLQLQIIGGFTHLVTWLLMFIFASPVSGLGAFSM